MTLQILDGEREAYYGAIGALNDVDLRDGFVLDVGGGSAQISRVENRCFVRGQSAPIGALALTEGYIKSDPPHQRELAAVQIEIDRRLDALFWHRDEEGPLTGLGGAIRNLAAIDAAAGHYPLETLHGYVLSAANLDAIVEQLASTSLEGRRKIAGLNPDRADIILPGAMVAQSVMCRLGVDRLTISTNGLREGLLFEHFWRHLAEPVAPDVRSFGTLNLARIYEYNKSHATHVRFLARRLFDQLGPLHGYGPAERDLLDAASTLHDIGTVVAYDKHDRHGFTLISNNGLPGYTPREIGLIALLTRYHRKGTPRSIPFAQYSARMIRSDSIRYQHCCGWPNTSSAVATARSTTLWSTGTMQSCA